MKLRTLIIDDEPIALEKLSNYVGRTASLELAAECGNGFEAIDYLADNEVDLVITDINMPDLNGLDFVKSLSKKPLIIFTTAYDQYAIESYRVSAVDYLLKPYSFADFQKAVTKAVNYVETRSAAESYNASASDTANDGPIFVKSDSRLIRINPADILYVKGFGEYLKIFLLGQKSPIMTLSSFAALREKLDSRFRQIHRSFMVNVDHIKQVDRHHIHIDEQTELPVSDSYRADFFDFLAARSVGAKK